MYGVGRHAIDKKSEEEYEIVDRIEDCEGNVFYKLELKSYTKSSDDVEVPEEKLEQDYYLEMCAHLSELDKEHRKKTKTRQHRKATTRFYY